MNDKQSLIPKKEPVADSTDAEIKKLSELVEADVFSVINQS